MNLLAAKLYDPASAVSKSTATLIAMTAFDTTNLRLAVVVPAHGMVRFRLRCMLEGATTFPQILLGVLNGSTVVGRVAPHTTLDGTALATTFAVLDAEFTVTGLTPGSTNFDAAYGVETVVASTNIKYGGPNNTTANDAFGGFVFEAWDPQPQTANSTLAVDANGRVDVIKVAGTTQTARDLGAQLDAAVSSRMATFTLPANFSSLVIDANGRIDLSKVLGAAISALISGRLDVSVGAYQSGLTPLQPTVAGRTLDVTATGEAGVDLDNTVGTLAKGTDLTGFSDLDGAGVRGAIGLATANLDTQLTSIESKTANLPATPAATGDAMALTPSERAAVADRLLGRNQQGGSDAGPTVAQAIASGLLKIEIVGTTMTVKHGDGTTAFTRTLTRAVADEIVSLV